MDKASALQYKDGMDAPLIICNGKALIAEKIIQIARDKDVPIVYEPETVDILSMCEVGDFIPVETWKIVAGVFAFMRGQVERVSEN